MSTARGDDTGSQLVSNRDTARAQKQNGSYRTYCWWFISSGGELAAVTGAFDKEVEVDTGRSGSTGARRCDGTDAGAQAVVGAAEGTK